MRRVNGRETSALPWRADAHPAQEVVHGAGALELTQRECARSWETIDFYQLVNDSQASPARDIDRALLVDCGRGGAPNSRPGTPSSRLRSFRARRLAAEKAHLRPRAECGMVGQICCQHPSLDPLLPRVRIERALDASPAPSSAGLVEARPRLVEFCRYRCGPTAGLPTSILLTGGVT